MALELLEFDAAGSNVDGTSPGSPLVLMSTSSNYYVTAFSSPAPNPKLQWASSIDTEGARRADPSTYENRTVSLTVETKDTSSTSTHLDALTGKVTKLHREGGTLKWTRKDGSVRIFDIRAADSYAPVIDIKYENGRAEVQLQFTAPPEMRGGSILQADRPETTLPVLIATETGIGGDFSAGGKIVIDNDAAVDWWGVAWAIETDALYTHTTAAGSGGLFYEAESRTAMGGSATAVGPTGASGAGSNVMRNTALSTSYQAILSTQASGAGAHWTHVGAFRIITRVQIPTTNTGTVSVALEWGAGDFRRFTQNTTLAIDPVLEGKWLRLDLGLVNIPKVAQGSQRWEGRILAKSTVAGDDIDVDWLALFPADYGSGIAQAVNRAYTPTSFSARDEFDQTAGNLNTKTLPIGGAWATSGGGATDFSVGSGVVSRAATGDRTAVAGTATFTNVAAKVDVRSDDTATGMALFVRYTDTNNNLTVSIQNGVCNVTKWVASVFTILASTTVSHPTVSKGFMTLSAVAMANGAWTVKFGTTELSGVDTALATGGGIASGKVAFWDQGGSTVQARTFDNFAVWVPPSDAGAFAGQSLEIRDDSVIREDASGAFWQPVSSYEGAYLRVPNSGAEARAIRWIAQPLYRKEEALREVRVDDRIDDISGRMTYYSRYLS